MAVAWVRLRADGVGGETLSFSDELTLGRATLAASGEAHGRIVTAMNSVPTHSAASGGATRAATTGLPAGQRPHRLGVRLLLILAGVCMFCGSFAVWINAQLLNTDNWVSTSSRILANGTVRNAVGTYIVRQAFSSAAGGLDSLLPGQLGDALTGGAQQAASAAVSGLLAEPVAQDVWRDANRVAHREALDILNGRSDAVSASRGEVVLDLHPLVHDLAKQLGTGSGSVAQLLDTAIPADRGRLVILRSSQLQTAQTVVKATPGLSIALPLAAVACLALAMVLARGWRWVALRGVGWCALTVGIAVVIARRILEWRIVDGLVTSPSSRDAGDAAWAIASKLLLDIALGLIVTGAVIAAASIAGARLDARRHAAPART